MHPDVPDSGRHKFPRKEKLKHRKSIQFLFDKGMSLVIHPLRLVYYTQPAIPQQDIPKFSVSVSKKNFGKAVDRNQLKRRIREAYRLNKGPLIQFCKEKGTSLHMMWIFTGNELKEYADILDILQRILQKLHRKISTSSSSSMD
ncbi:MAG: ribonuclease P protein component [Saprospiraceae bacterium]